MEKELIPMEPFRKQLYDCCMAEIVKSIKELEALEFIERDRGLFPYEKAAKISYSHKLRTNEEWILIADPDYLRIQ